LDGQWISVQELVDSLTLSAPPPAPPEEEPSYEISEKSAESDVTSQIEMAVLPVLEEPALEETNEPPSFPTSVESEKTSEHAYVSAPEAPAPPNDFNAGFQPPPRPSEGKTNTKLRSAALQAQQAQEAKTPAEALVETAPTVEATPVVEESSYTSADAPTSLPPTVATLAQTTANNDPALSMLSSLQLFKERHGNHREPAYDPTLVIHSDTVGRESGIPLRMWLTAIFAGMVLGCLSWGVIRVLKAKPTAPAGTMVQQSALPKTPPPVSQPVTASGSSAFKTVEPPKESARRAPPRPLIAPVSAPAPVRVQPEERVEDRRDEQQEQPPQPQYAPQYQQYPQTGDQIPAGQYPQANAPVPVPPAQNVNGQNIYPSEQMPPGYTNGGGPGADQMAPPQQQPPPGTMGGYPANPNVQGAEPNYNNAQPANPYNNGGAQEPNQQQNGYNNNGAEQQQYQQQQQPPPPPNQ
jgi:hypothetical protein